MTRIFAAADIGSNTAHLLIAGTDGELVMRIDNLNEWIPLGEVVARKGEVPKEYGQQLVLAIKEFRRLAREKQAQTLYVFATEGMRMARNHAQVLKKIETETGITVEIISPHREAELSMRGISLDTRNIAPETLFEVGGGSAQIGRIMDGNLVAEQSLPLGTGRLLAESGLSNPCSDLAFRAAERYIEATLERLTIPPHGAVAVGSGGVIRGLWRALHADGDKVLGIEEIDYMIWSAARLPVDRLVARFGVKTKRAGTLLAGALVYRGLMRKMGLNSIVISEFGIREGAILEMASGRVKGCLV